MNKFEKKAYQCVVELIDEKIFALSAHLIKDASTKAMNRNICCVRVLSEIDDAIKIKMDEPYYICSKVNRKSSKCRICEAGKPYPKNKVHEIFSIGRIEMLSTVGAWMKGDIDSCGAKAVVTKFGR